MNIECVCVCPILPQYVCVYGEEGTKSHHRLQFHATLNENHVRFHETMSNFKRFHIFTSRRSLVPISILVSLRLPIVVVVFSASLRYNEYRLFLLLFSFYTIPFAIISWFYFLLMFIGVGIVFHLSSTHQYGSRTTLAHSALNAKSFWYNVSHEVTAVFPLILWPEHLYGYFHFYDCYRSVDLEFVSPKVNSKNYCNYQASKKMERRRSTRQTVNLWRRKEFLAS